MEWETKRNLIYLYFLSLPIGVLDFPPQTKGWWVTESHLCSYHLPSELTSYHHLEMRGTYLLGLVSVLYCLIGVFCCIFYYNQYWCFVSVSTLADTVVLDMRINNFTIPASFPDYFYAVCSSCLMLAIFFGPFSPYIYQDKNIGLPSHQGVI